jgi:L-ascorbate metabolism protein UlaG (beta-lactamase superfamily)
VIGSCILLTAGVVPQRPPLEARFIGNMAFAITDGMVTLMTDFPYESGYSGYMTYDRSAIRSTTPTTLSLITHRHRDHWERALFMTTDWRVAGPPDVVNGLPDDRVVPLSGRTVFQSLTIDPIETPHGVIGHYSYVVTWHGRRMYFSGDTDSPDSVIASKNLDVAFVSPWMFRSTLKRGERIDARRVVIYHHRSDERVGECAAGCVQPRQVEVIRID